MSSHEVLQEHAVATPAAGPLRPGKRLVGIDVARGLALIGLLAVHILPDENEVTGEPTLAWTLFSGHSAALFALLAGVGLALSTGGATPHQGRGMTADRLGVAVRAVMVGAAGLIIAAILPWDPPANSILVYYAAFFLVTIPFLHLRARTLFLSAAVCALVFPLLLLWLGPELPESSAWNHTVINLLTEPLGTASELLLTGNYPALAYMVYVLVGLGVGRLDLRSTRVQAIIAGTGAALAVLASLVSFLLLHAAGGYEGLRAASDLTRSELDWALTFGFEDVSEVSAWWLAVITAHSNTTLAIASSLGLGLAATGMFLLITPRTGRLLTPLAAMGAMTLTLYSAHLLALTPGTHENNPALWFTLHLAVAALFAWFWRQRFGQGPLERVVAATARKARQTITG